MKIVEGRQELSVKDAVECARLAKWASEQKGEEARAVMYFLGHILAEADILPPHVVRVMPESK